MPPPLAPMAGPPNGTEMWRGRQDGKPAIFTPNIARGPKGDAGAASTVAGPKGDPGPAGTPKRVEIVTATSNASGVATLVFPAFVIAPVVVPLGTWAGAQLVIGQATAVTTTGATITVMRSRATLLLSAGPFESAPNTVVSMLIIG